MKKRTGILARRDGAALIVVLVVFVVLMILFGSIASLFSRNLVQAKVQERKTQAYYLALSGLDLATAALLDDTLVGGTLLSKIMDSATAEHNSFQDYQEQHLALVGGEVDLRMKWQEDPTASGTYWVIVESTATLNGSGTTRKLTQRILGNNPKVIERLDAAP